MKNNKFLYTERSLRQGNLEITREIVKKTNNYKQNLESKNTYWWFILPC